MAKLTLQEIKERGFLKISDKITPPVTKSQLAEGLFDADASDKRASFFIENNIEVKKVQCRVWAVIFDSKRIGKLNRLLEDGIIIRETLNNHFPMEIGELRVAFRSVDNSLNYWEFVGVFKFIGEDKPDDFERQDMPSNCFTNCYERISDELILKDRVWHYTRMDVLGKIFLPKENCEYREGKIRLRFIDSKSSKNDPLESLILCNLLKKNKKKINDRYVCSDVDFQEPSEESYVFSMSYLRDSHAFWNKEYAGTKGIAIEFNSEKFKNSIENYKGGVFADIDYEGLIENICKDINSRYESDKKLGKVPPEFSALKYYLCYYSSFYKSLFWEHEQEVRVALVKDSNGEKINSNIELGDKCIRSYFEYFDKNIVSSIILGPDHDSKDVELVKEYLKKNGYSNIEVSKSKAFDLRYKD